MDRTYHTPLQIVTALLLSFLAGCANHSNNATAIAQFEPFMVCLELPTQPKNPFDPDEIAIEGVFVHETGARFSVPAFWHQEFDYKKAADCSAELLEPIGKPGFRLRFTPRMTGRYRWNWRIKRGLFVETQPGGELLASPPVGKGFAARSPSNRYLMTSLGDPLFLIGQNVAWSGEPCMLADMRRYIDEMADSGQNCLRLWHCTWGFGFEREQVGQYDLARAWALDQIVEHARKRGVYLVFCLENAHDISERKSPYWELMAQPEDFYTSAQTRTAFKNRMRYAAGRWGYSTSILAWEFFNEMEYTLLGPLENNPEVREKYFAPWLHEMAQAMKTYDGHSHLLTNSLATDRIWTGMNDFPWMDIVQQHTYLNAWDGDETTKVLLALEDICHHEKPCILGEFGGSPAGMYGATSNVVHNVDTEGIHLHNSLWTAAMIGSAGTPLNWWWDEYIRPRKLYYHYAALSRFLQGTPWLDNQLETYYLPVNDARVMMVRGPTWARVWVRHRDYTWQRSGKTSTIQPSKEFPLQLVNFIPGIYRIEWWNTTTGRIERSEAVRCDGSLTLKIPAVQTDVAAKIQWMSDGKARSPQ